MKTETSWKRRFLRKKLKYMVSCVCVVSILFVGHQLFYLKKLNQAVIDELIAGSSQTADYFVTKKIRPRWTKPVHPRLFRGKDGSNISLHGTRDQDIPKYLPNIRGNFVCFASKEEIDYSKINDNYCDCPLDGSDEPGTNACNNGVFYCERSSSKHSVIKISSYKVKDGYCDCCDGSDEWFDHKTLSTPLVPGHAVYQNTNCQNKC